MTTQTQQIRQGQVSLTQNTVMNVPHGFENQTDSTITYNGATKTFSIAPTGTSFNVWVQGVKYTYTTTQTVIHSSSNNLYLCYVDNTGTFQASSTIPSYAAAAYCSYVLYMGSGLYIGPTEERHSCVMDSLTHMELHNQIGTYYVSGLAASGYVISPSTPTDANNQVAFATGIISDEGLNSTIAAIAAGGPYAIVYLATTYADWTYDIFTVPFAWDNNGAQPLYYNYNAGGNWSEFPVPDNNYVNYYACFVPSFTTGTQLLMVMGQTTYTSLAAAQGETFANLTLPTLPMPEILPLYQITLRRNPAYTNMGKCRIEGFTRIIGTRASIINNVAGNHEALSGLQLAATGITWGHINDQAQTIAGAKTFPTAPILSSLTASTPLGLDASNNMVSVAYGSTAGTICQGNDSRLSGTGYWTLATGVLSPTTPGTNVSFGTGGLLDQYVTTAIPFGDSLNASLTTNAQSIIGGINEVKAASGGISYETHLTSGTTITLTSASKQEIFFTGTTNQTVKLPDATTLLVGRSFKLINQAYSAISVYSNGSQFFLQKMPALSTMTVTCIGIANADGQWSAEFSYDDVFFAAHPLDSSATWANTSIAASGNYTLTNTSPQNQICIYSGTVTTITATMNLPDATTLPVNRTYAFYVGNCTLAIKDNSGTTIVTANGAAAYTAYIYFVALTNNSTAAGTWSVTSAAGCFLTTYLDTRYKTRSTSGQQYATTAYSSPIALTNLSAPIQRITGNTPGTIALPSAATVPSLGCVWEIQNRSTAAMTVYDYNSTVVQRVMPPMTDCRFIVTSGVSSTGQWDNHLTYVDTNGVFQSLSPQYTITQWTSFANLPLSASSTPLQVIYYTGNASSPAYGVTLPDARTLPLNKQFTFMVYNSFVTVYPNTGGSIGFCGGESFGWETDVYTLTDNSTQAGTWLITGTAPNMITDLCDLRYLQLNGSSTVEYLSILASSLYIDATSASVHAPAIGTAYGVCLGQTYTTVGDYSNISATAPYNWTSTYQGKWNVCFKYTNSATSIDLWSFTPAANTAYYAKIKGCTGGAISGAGAQGGIFEITQYMYNRNGSMGAGSIGAGLVELVFYAVSGTLGFVVNGSQFTLRWSGDTSQNKAVTMDVEIISCLDFV